MSVIPGYRAFGISSLVLALAACSGSDSEIPEPPPEPKPPAVNSAKAFSGPLTQASATQLGQFLRNGVYSSTLQGHTLELFDGSASPAPSIAATSGVSRTNTQVEGVDEADRIEYDGDHLYIATNPQWVDDELQGAKIRVLQRQSDYSLIEVNALTLPGEEQELDGLFLTEDRLSALSSNRPIYPLWGIAIEPWITPEGKVDVTIYDTTEPDQSSTLSHMQIDGWLLGSRQIGDQLYVVTSYVPGVEGLETGEQSDAVLIQNYKTITDTPIADLMPQVTIDGTPVQLNQPEDCYIPSEATSEDGYAQLLTITRVNVQQPDDIESTCLSSMAFMMYMSQDSLYLASDLGKETVFHKIALEQLAYQATGAVDGQLGWRGEPNLRVDEYQGYFRVVSSDFSGEVPQHKLTVLQQQGDELTAIANLPNDAQPEPIGKPGEDVYAVRFFGDKAYIVTFEQIDPLYALDLSVPEQPFVAGSLEIPGFSSYLHPMENGYLLGVGQQVEFLEEDATDPDEETGTGEGGNDSTGDSDETTPPPPPQITTGMKVSLFDVTDPANPKELANLVRERGYTPVEYDYKALTFTVVDGKYRFALPVEEWGGRGAKSVPDVAETSIIADVRNSLMLLETDTNAASPQLLEVGEIVAEGGVSGYYGGNDRSVIHGDHVYFIHGSQVWHGLWQQDNKADGPY